MGVRDPWTLDALRQCGRSTVSSAAAMRGDVAGLARDSRRGANMLVQDKHRSRARSPRRRASRIL